MHGEPWSNAEVSVVGFLKLVHDFASYVTKTQGQLAKLPVISRARWVPPNERWVRVNADAALLDDNVVGVGAVFRDAQGRVVRDVVHQFR